MPFELTTLGDVHNTNEKVNTQNRAGSGLLIPSPFSQCLALPWASYPKRESQLLCLRLCLHHRRHTPAETFVLIAWPRSEYIDKHMPLGAAQIHVNSLHLV
jgi:hypothetical protein